LKYRPKEYEGVGERCVLHPAGGTGWRIVQNLFTNKRIKPSDLIMQIELPISKQGAVHRINTPKLERQNLNISVPPPFRHHLALFTPRFFSVHISVV
jgi:hypothetical protein